MSTHIFTYGTLMFESVWLKVTSTTCKTANAQIRGFKRTAVKGKVYPALIAGGKNNKVDGIIYFEVSDDTIQKLDRFEGHAYSRSEIAVQIEEGKKISAQTYVLKNEYFSIIEDLDWNQQQFAKRHLAAFLDRDE